MEAHALGKAATYLNNLLLARGLLTNGKEIDFARPDREGSTDATMARIINLVHDLVLRRDQDAEHRENLAAAIRKARADEAQRLLDLQRAQEKNADLVRDAATLESQERTLKASIRRAELQAKELREQMLKMKSTLDQVRAKCLSDIRKRDVELEKLKGHLAGMQRGKREVSGMKINVINAQPAISGREQRRGQDVDNADWSLERESSDFLSALLNETSTENVALRQIVMDTMEVLKDLSGIDEDDGTNDGTVEDDGIGIPGQYRNSRRRALEAAQDPSLISCDAIAEQMNLILEHCKGLLQDPSFVSIEEVHRRDEEIVKLRIGWEKMANRWKQAITMMGEWRKRMHGEGDNASGNELSSLAFGKSIAVFPSGQPIFEEDEELSSILYDKSTQEEADLQDEADREMLGEDDEVADPADILVDHLHDQSDLDIPPEPSPKRRASRRKSFVSGKPVRPLQAIDINAQRPAKRVAVDSPPEARKTGDADDAIASIDSKNDIDSAEEKPVTRIPVPKTRAEPTMSIPEKLAAVEAEAALARAERAKGVGSQKRKKGDPSKLKKASRRRSTLSPEELANLMGVR